MNFKIIVKIASLALLALAFGQTAVAMEKSQKELNEALSKAVKNGNCAEVSNLIDSGADINDKDCDGWIPLAYSCCAGYAEIVKLLLDRGADVNRKVYNTPLQLVFSNANKNIEIIKLLLDHNADVNSTYENKTLLYHACKDNNAELVSLLLNYGADANSDEGNLLYRACQNDYAEVAKLLLDRGVTVNYKDINGTPLHYACTNNNLELVKLLLPYYDHVAIHKIFDSNLLHYNGAYDSRIAQLLLDNGAGAFINAKNRQGNTPLHYACSNRKLESVRLFLKWSADINSKNKEGQTPLHHACSGSIQKSQEQLVKLLLHNGADIDCKDNEGKTPLDLAHSNGYTEIEELLINEPQRRENKAAQQVLLQQRLLNLKNINIPIFLGRK